MNDRAVILNVNSCGIPSAHSQYFCKLYVFKSVILYHDAQFIIGVKSRKELWVAHHEIDKGRSWRIKVPLREEIIQVIIWSLYVIIPERHIVFCEIILSYQYVLAATINEYSRCPHRPSVAHWGILIVEKANFLNVAKYGSSVISDERIVSNRNIIDIV